MRVEDSIEAPLKKPISVGDKIFTYGTLRRGQYNYFRLQMERRSAFLGTAILQGFGMYDVSGFFPGLKIEADSTVVGEVFEVVDQTLGRSIDTLEGYPRMYDRTETMASLDGKPVRVWVYVFQFPTLEKDKIRSGDWLNKGGAEDGETRRGVS